MKTLVLGLGNPILTDDGVGIHVVRAVQSCLTSYALRMTPHVSHPDFGEASVGGLRLLEFLSGYERVIIVDAIQTPGGKPGEIHRLHPGDLRASLHAGSTHDLSLTAALALGREMGMALPADEDIVIIAVEAEDVLTFGETCTSAVAAAIPRAVEAVLAELSALEKPYSSCLNG